MAYSNHYHSFSPEDQLEPFNTEHLRLSSHRHKDIEIDSFDLSLDDSAHSSFANSQDFDGVLEGMPASLEMSDYPNSIFLEHSNRTVDSTMLEYDSMCFDYIQVEENEVRQSRHNNSSIHRGRRCSSHSLPSKQRIEVDDVNFDPTPYNHQQYQRQSSCNESDILIKTSPHTSAPSSYNSQPSSRPQRSVCLDSGIMPPSLSQPPGGSAWSGVHEESSAKNLQYHKALEKFYESMKRTELSRRQLEMQCTLIGAPVSARYHRPQPYVVTLTSAQQILQQRVEGASDVSTRFLWDESHSPNDGSSNMAAFFSGSKGTLTNGLEHSRRQLSIYADQVRKNQTL